MPASPIGSGLYPDATGTLRLAFGIVKGYQQDGDQIPAWTTIGVLQHEQRHDAKPPFQLPESWHGAHDKLDLKTPFNFVSTADITGGNSGSPVVNRNGELVGIIFDSNRQGVAMNFAFEDVQSRAVSVDSRAVIEALRNIYGADALLAELLGVAVGGAMADAKPRNRLMGADGWAELAPWREDPKEALRALHAEVISTLDIPVLIQRAMRDTQEQITIWESEGDPYELVRGYKEQLAELEAAARGRLSTEVDDQAALVRLCCLDRSEGLGIFLTWRRWRSRGVLEGPTVR